MRGKPVEIVNRDAEWGTLAAAWGSTGPELVFVVGRRRAGKSYLLWHFARAAGGVYYQATERTESEQLAALSGIVGEHFNDAALRRVSLPDWESLFGYVTDKSAGGPFLLVLDEFPYLERAAPAFASVLQSWWDHQWRSARVRVVLSGSHISAMRRLESADRPLYGRRTARLGVHPFSYRELSAFVPAYSARERLLTYGVFGGVCGHLSVLNPSRDLGENVITHMLDSRGRLVDEAERMLDAFLGEAELHYSIVEAIAKGDHTWSRIASRVGKQAGSLSRPARWLVEMEVIARVVPITEPQPDKSKRALYRIVDPYVAFWHRFIAPLVRTGAIGPVAPRQLWQAIEPQLDDYMGPVFEEICRSYCWQAGNLAFDATRVGEWWDSDSQNQVDVVALGANGDVLMGECKWGGVTQADLTRLQQRAERLAPELSGVRRIHLAVFTARPIDDPGLLDRMAAENIVMYTPEHLFAAPSRVQS